MVETPSTFREYCFINPHRQRPSLFQARHVEATGIKNYHTECTIRNISTMSNNWFIKYTFYLCLAVPQICLFLSWSLPRFIDLVGLNKCIHEFLNGLFYSHTALYLSDGISSPRVKTIYFLPESQI